MGREKQFSLLYRAIEGYDSEEYLKYIPESEKTVRLNGDDLRKKVSEASGLVQTHKEYKVHGNEEILDGDKGNYIEVRPVPHGCGQYIKLASDNWFRLAELCDEFKLPFIPDAVVKNEYTVMK